MADTVAVTYDTCGTVFWISPERAAKKTTHICDDCAQ